MWRVAAQDILAPSSLTSADTATHTKMSACPPPRPPAGQLVEELHLHERVEHQAGCATLVQAQSRLTAVQQSRQHLQTPQRTRRQRMDCTLHSKHSRYVVAVKRKNAHYLFSVGHLKQARSLPAKSKAVPAAAGAIYCSLQFR